MTMQLLGNTFSILAAIGGFFCGTVMWLGFVGIFKILFTAWWLVLFRDATFELGSPFHLAAAKERCYI